MDIPSSRKHLPSSASPTKGLHNSVKVRVDEGRREGGEGRDRREGEGGTIYRLSGCTAVL